MKVVIVGSGGREAALAHHFAFHGHDVKVSPGRAGIPGSTDTDPLELTADLFVIGPDLPVVNGLADQLRAQGKAVYAPGRDGGRLEGSKVFMKSFLKSSDIPTANYVVFAQGHAQAASDYIETSKGPWVIKTDYLAAGKGVLVTSDRQAAKTDVVSKLADGAIVIEEVLPGVEVSVMAITNGRQFRLLPFAQDYKRVHSNDQGANTGGMGAYAPVVDIISPAQAATVISAILKGLKDHGIDYRGTLYVGLMVHQSDLKVLEINARFGDPETQAQLPLVKNDLAALLYAAATNQDLPELEVSGAAVAIVMAAAGYPENPIVGHHINGLVEASRLDNVIIHHAGTTRDDRGQYMTAGGRTLNVVGLGDTVALARDRAYQAVGLISWEGEHHRSDIGLKH